MTSSREVKFHRFHGEAAFNRISNYHRSSYISNSIITFFFFLFFFFNREWKELSLFLSFLFYEIGERGREKEENRNEQRKKEKSHPRLFCV